MLHETTMMLNGIAGNKQIFSLTVLSWMFACGFFRKTFAFRRLKNKANIPPPKGKPIANEHSFFHYGQLTKRSLCL